MVAEHILDANYETVAASQTDQVLGAVGAKGDFIRRLVFVVAIAASSTADLDDGGGTNIPLLAANTPIGIYTAEIEIRSRVGAWRITTGAGVSIIAVGQFT